MGPITNYSCPNEVDVILKKKIKKKMSIGGGPHCNKCDEDVLYYHGHADCMDACFEVITLSLISYAIFLSIL